jgi:C_GCAxxG_C_C family probable redox protein
MRTGKIEAATDYFKSGYNCAQALLAAFGPRYGLDRGAAFKIAAAFGSGMGVGAACGAVSGAFMVIGLGYSNDKKGGIFSRDRTEAVAQEFVVRFTARNKTTICPDLLGCDISTAEGRKVAKQERHFKKKCPQYVLDAAEILDELLKE